MATTPIKTVMCLGLLLSTSVLFAKQNEAAIHPECFVGSKKGQFKFNAEKQSAYISGLSTSQKSPLKFTYFTLGLATPSEKCDNPFVWIVNDSTTYIIGYRSETNEDEIGVYKVDFDPGRKSSVKFYKIDQLKPKQQFRGSAFLSIAPTPKLCIRFDDSPEQDSSYSSPDHFTEPNGLLIYNWHESSVPNWHLKRPKQIQIRHEDLAFQYANILLYASQILGDSLKTPLLRDLESPQSELLCKTMGNYCLGFFYGFSCPARFGDTEGYDNDNYKLPFDGARDCKESDLYENLLKDLRKSNPDEFFKYPYEQAKTIDAYSSGDFAEYALGDAWLQYLSVAIGKILTEFRPKNGQRITREDYLAQTVLLLRKKESEFIGWSEKLSGKLKCNQCPLQINIQATLSQVKKSATKSRIEFENRLKTAVSRVPAKTPVFRDRFTYELFYSDIKFSKKQIDGLSEGKISLDHLLDSGDKSRLESFE